MTVPRFPIYIPSKGRWESRFTIRSLEAMHVPYKVIVEEQEYDLYAKHVDPKNILTLDKRHVDEYDPCCKLPPGASKGSGPARNLAWDHAAVEGHEFLWIVDDNIDGFYHLNRNAKILAGDATVFRAMEDFTTRFRNVAMAGPNYEMFVPRKKPKPPYTLNTRIYSCNLIRTSLPFRWRCRYNEDTDLSLRLLKAGWCTILFNAFLQNKKWTGKVKGGNTDELYKDGTTAKSQMLARLHPDVARVAMRFSRVHHMVDYSGFKQGLVLNEDKPAGDGKEYERLQVVQLPPGITYAMDWRDHVIKPAAKKGKR